MSEKHASIHFLLDAYKAGGSIRGEDYSRALTSSTKENLLYIIHLCSIKKAASLVRGRLVECSSVQGTESVRRDEVESFL